MNDDIKTDKENFEKLKKTIAVQQRELIEEKLKAKALTDELKKPVNVHRWQKLRDTNTDAYSLVKKVRRSLVPGCLFVYSAGSSVVVYCAVSVVLLFFFSHSPLSFLPSLLSSLFSSLFSLLSSGP
jgi:hypothetical protein